MKFWKKWFGKKISSDGELIASEDIPTAKTLGKYISMNCVILDENYNEISDKQYIEFGLFLENDKILIKNINSVRFNVCGDIKYNASIFLLFKNNKPIISGNLTTKTYVTKYIHPLFDPGALSLIYNPDEQHEKVINNWTMSQVMQ